MEVIHEHEKDPSPIAPAIEKLKEVGEKAMGFVREQPAAAILGALAFGFVVARLIRRVEG